MNANNGNDKAFLDRLTSIVEANLSNEQFGVSELAKEMRMNRSQLYVRIKSITKKSASRFIQEIRVNKAFELLQQTDQNVSEVAYNVGFSSPAYFNNCFHEYFGFSPGKAKNHVLAETGSMEHQGEPNPIKIRAFRQPSKFIIASVATVVLIGTYLGSQTFLNNKSQTDSNFTSKSIVVLPLKNLSNNPEIQYLADGVMEDILSRLSHVEGLVVKSRISSEKMGGENFSAEEIAKESNVAYFLDGSIIPENDKIRINVRLINAKEDKYEWANHFDKDLTEILPFITEVSGEITNQLEIILSPEEKEQVEKTYTENKEAYKLYLEGRFYYQLRTKESFEKSIGLYNQALALDLNFCLAYAGLADSYVTSTWYGFLPKEKGIPKSRAYALKALKIDNNLAEAHATLGAIASYFDYDWDMAEKELKLAMKINPGYARAYKLYSEFMNIVGQEKQAHQYINKAKELNPTYVNNIWLSYIYYLESSDYDKSLSESAKIFGLNNNSKQYYWRNFFVYTLQNKYTEAINEYKKLLPVDSSPGKTNLLDSLYAASGYNGVLRYIADFEEKNLVTYNEDRYRYYNIAIYYAILNDTKAALDYLGKAQKEGGKAIRMKYDDALKGLRNEPRFIALLKKMNLTNEQLNEFFFKSN